MRRCPYSHLPDAELPPACAVLNPNRPDCPYPEKNLCGAGVAFKIAQALLESSPVNGADPKRLISSFLKIVAIATIEGVVANPAAQPIPVVATVEGVCARTAVERIVAAAAKDGIVTVVAGQGVVTSTTV